VTVESSLHLGSSRSSLHGRPESESPGTSILHICDEAVTSGSGLVCLRTHTLLVLTRHGVLCMYLLPVGSFIGGEASPPTHQVYGGVLMYLLIHNAMPNAGSSSAFPETRLMIQPWYNSKGKHGAQAVRPRIGRALDLTYRLKSKCSEVALFCSSSVEAMWTTLK
jgi:hypothetical protein